MDGYYPRINAAMLQSGAHAGKIASFVGKVKSVRVESQQVDFQTSDGGIVVFDSSSAEVGDESEVTLKTYEAIGQVNDDNSVTLFILRELSSDTNLDVYNKMITLQHDPKYASYFVPVEVMETKMETQ